MNNRVFVIGLDGADWNVLDQFIDRGLMPNLLRLVENGVKGKLRSTIPPMTPQAWVSFMTGVNPGKHGVFGFSSTSVKNPYLGNHLNRYSLKSPTLWKYLSEFGLKSIVINVPVTYPPEKIDGILISGMFSPISDPNFIFPKEISQELKNIGIDYQIDIKSHFNPKLRRDAEYINELIKNSADDLLEELFNMTNSRMKTINFLIKKDWSLFTVVFVGFDRIQHFLWNYLMKDSSDDNPIGEKISEFYTYVDTCIGKLIASVGEDVNLVLVSDHGFGKFHGDFFLNKWLLDNDFLSKSQGLNRQNIFRSIKKISTRLGLNSFIMNRKVSHDNLRKLTLSSHDIDWGRTKAFHYQANGIRINLKGREPLGFVEPSDYEIVRSQIIQKLSGLTDGWGKKIIEKIFRKEDIYSGRESENAPDLVIKFRDDRLYAAYSKEINIDTLFKKNNWKQGDHTLNGICLFHGNGLQQGQIVENCEILDIMPTILYMMGQTIPDHVDGRVLSDIFIDDHLKINKVKYSTMDKHRLMEKEEIEYSKEDEEIINERLRGLGYID